MSELQARKLLKKLLDMTSENTREMYDLVLPVVEVKEDLKKVFVTGRSRMPDPGKYYMDLYHSFQDLFISFKRTLVLEIYFDYLSSSSSKWLMYVFKQLDSLLLNQGGLIELNWLYDQDDEPLYEFGKLLQSKLSYTVNLIEI